MIEVRATKAANALMRGLYGSGVWIKSSRAKHFAGFGLAFLQAYSRCASRAYNQGLRRFPLHPKLHFCHHLLMELLCQAQISNWCLSPLCFSVQLEEDFIGKPSRISRRVSSKRHCLRTLQRLMLAMAAEYARVEEQPV